MLFFLFLLKTWIVGTRLAEAVLTSTHNLCFEQKYEKYHNFLSEHFKFLEEKFSIYLKNQIFSPFPIVKMKPNHAEICRAGNLEPDFQQVSLVQIFWNFHSIVVKHQSFKFSKEK